MFHEPVIQSTLSHDNDDNAAADDNDNIDADSHLVDEDEEAESDEGGVAGSEGGVARDEEAESDEGGVASGDEDHVVEAADDVLVTMAQRQHSTTEYLPGMLHSNSPAGLLPKFPSWSLLQLGDYSSYNPSTGNDVCLFGTSDSVIILGGGEY